MLYDLNFTAYILCLFQIVSMLDIEYRRHYIADLFQMNCGVIFSEYFLKIIL